MKSWYKIAQQIYRGDPTPISMDQYDVEYALKQNVKSLGQIFAYGPGIYFASHKDVAEMYGANITQKELKNDANMLTENMPPLNKKVIISILQGIDPEKLETAASSWDENYQAGIKMVIDSIMNETNPVDQLLSIWANVYFHQNPQNFMNVMSNKGIDGIVKTNNDVTFYVIYNLNVLG